MANNVRDEIERRRIREAREGLEPNETHWVNMLVGELLMIGGHANHVRDGAWEVLRSRAGDPVFPAQPPSAPDTP